MWQRLLNRLFGRMAAKLVYDRIEQLKAAENSYNEATRALKPVYTTIRTYSGYNTEYYGFICQLLNSQEWNFFLLDLRENVINEFLRERDEKQLLIKVGRLEMLNIINNYLSKYKSDYEKVQIR